LLFEDLSRFLPSEGLAWPVVERVSDGLEVLGGPSRKVCAFGKYWRSRPLVFSLVGRCHGECGSAKNTCVPVSIANSA